MITGQQACPESRLHQGDKNGDQQLRQQLCGSVVHHLAFKGRRVSIRRARVFCDHIHYISRKHRVGIFSTFRSWPSSSAYHWWTRSCGCGHSNPHFFATVGCEFSLGKPLGSASRCTMLLGERWNWRNALVLEVMIGIHSYSNYTISFGQHSECAT